ncbi:MAG: DNA methyltransferase, partial [Bacteroidales bacterium]|nr:DNA methyltransferase [Bacteroidales bacterium]
SDGKHKVQILDPAAGTGTFIGMVIAQIYTRILASDQKGSWPSYVHHELLPRIFGFELMMAPYTIAHLKLSMALKKTGFLYFNETRSGETRLGIYLTNSLEDTRFEQTLFSAFGLADSIAQEAEEASKIKNDKPIMVVVGNPPYSVSSSNKGEWITNLCKVYKQDLNERNIQPLSDDYIKFIRFAEHFIEKNKTGIVAMITNNSFIDGIIHRQMRKHLLETFDDIYILDLHGNSKKKETAPDGDKDENVFNIQQGVSINIMVKKNSDKKELGKVSHCDLFGKREQKYQFLNDTDIQKIKWQKLNLHEPYYFFVPKNNIAESAYMNGFQINDLFNIFTSGITTSDDNHLVSLSSFENNNFKYCYRPFDNRCINYDLDKVNRPRYRVMRHFFHPNIGISIMRKLINTKVFNTISVVDSLTDKNYYGFQTYIFPLYLYDNESKTPNFNQEIVNKITELVGDTSPEDIFDYIYAILHSPTYREKYKEFLKIDFPRVPYPKDKQTFRKLVELGKQLRQLHLLESPKVEKFITSYPESGSDVVEKPMYKNGNVYINETQYFGNVPEVAWNFYIGGYQPVQKWLKDRRGRTLINEDLEHY